MTRKDYVKLADALFTAAPPNLIARGFTAESERAEDRTWVIARCCVADVLAADNPRFDRQRFYSACEGRK